MSTKNKNRSESRRKTAGRAASRRPAARKTGLLDRLLHRAATNAQNRRDRRREDQRARRDAAVLRATHKNCPACRGLGQITLRGGNGEFKGSKPCPATPATLNAGHAITLHTQARFSADRDIGLWGWTCPCGAKGKPRSRTAKDANQQLATHNRKEHGGTSLGGTPYQKRPQGMPEPAVTARPAARSGAIPSRRRPVATAPKAAP